MLPQLPNRTRTTRASNRRRTGRSVELWIDSKSYCAAPARQSVRLAGAMCSCSCSFCLSRRFYGASFALNEGRTVRFADACAHNPCPRLGYAPFQRSRCAHRESPRPWNAAVEDVPRRYPGVNIDFRVYRSGEYMHLSNAELKALARNASGRLSGQLSLSRLHIDSIYHTSRFQTSRCEPMCRRLLGPRASLSGRPRVAPDSVKLYARWTSAFGG